MSRTTRWKRGKGKEKEVRVHSQLEFDVRGIDLRDNAGKED